MNKRCKHIEKDGFHTCGSYAFNLWKDDIDQGNLCDVHYWQNKAQRTWVGLTDEERINISYKADGNECVAVELTQAKLKELNT
jgi:hypothetical protein